MIDYYLLTIFIVFAILFCREIKNIKLANSMLKLKRKQAAEAAQQANLENIQAQAQANAQASEQAALAEVQKKQAISDVEVKVEQAKSQFEIQRMEREAQIKRQLMELEFQFNMQLGQQKIQIEADREKEIEDRKDKRAKIIGTQQSAMIDQKKNDLMPINFESSQDSNMPEQLGANMPM